MGSEGMRMSQHKALVALWLCILSSWALTEGISHDDGVSNLDDSLGESLGGDNFGYFCTPKGQMRPDYGYNDKDCASDGKVQKCGEVWCCNVEDGHYSCPRTNRVSDTKCAAMEKPLCSGPRPTGAADGKAPPPSCEDSHDSICAAAKAYGHCKHSSYANECPKACGVCGGPTSAGPSAKSVIAQVESKEAQKKLEASDDASAVAKHAAEEMNKEVTAANEAQDDVSTEKAAVAKAKKKLKAEERNTAKAVQKAAGAGERKVEDLKKQAQKVIKQQKAEVDNLKSRINQDVKAEQKTKEKLRETEEKADGSETDEAGVVEVKAKLSKAESVVEQEKKKLEKDKAMVAHGSSGSKALVAKEQKAQREAQRDYDHKKDKRSGLENEVADAVAKVTQLRAQVRQEAPDEAQVMAERNKLEKAEQELHRSEEAEKVVTEQEQSLEGNVLADQKKIKTLQAAIPAAVVEAKKDAQDKAAKEVKVQEAKDEIVEEQKLEQSAKLKVEEIAIDQKKKQALKDEGKQRVIFTDADLKAQSEGAFIRAEEKVDQIFDNLKPLVRQIEETEILNGGTGKGSAGGLSIEGDAASTPITPKDVMKDFVPDVNRAGAPSKDGVAQTMMDNMVQAKEMMKNAQAKIDQLKSVVEDDNLVVDVPKDVLAAAEDEAKKEADSIALKMAEAKAGKDEASIEKKEEKKAKDDADKEIQEEEAAESKMEQQEAVVKDKVAESKAEVKADQSVVSDLKHDVELAEKQMKQDTLPKNELAEAEAKTDSLRARLRTATRDVRSSRGSVKKAKRAVSAAKEEYHVAKKSAATQINDLVKEADQKVETAERHVEDVKVQVKTVKAKNSASQKLKNRVKTLKENKKMEKGEIKELKKQEDSEKEELDRTRTKMDAKVREAEDNEGKTQARAIKMAKDRGKRKIAAAKSALKDMKDLLAKSMKEAEARSSVADGSIKMCKQLVAPTEDSKDESSLCQTVFKEQHCNLFDYARYCEKSCGTCVL